MVALATTVAVTALAGCGGEAGSSSAAVGSAIDAVAAHQDTDAPTERSPSGKVRRFRLHYGATAVGLPAGAEVTIWLPVPITNQYQEMERIGPLPPGASQNTEPKYGNQMLHWRTTAPENGEVPLDVAYRIVRREVRAITPGSSPSSENSLPALQRELFLKPNRKVPVEGKPLELLKDLSLAGEPVALARQLYTAVDGHMRYNKEGTGWGEGDAIWACASGYGNCTDFHSLFISLARAKQLPSRFVIGFPLPAQRGQGTIGGYHCWAYFHVEGQGWIPVDISEADKHPEMKDYYFGNLTADRVAFTTGRDIELVPPQSGPALNYFVYPYIEVDGTPLAKEQIELRFRYEDE